MSGKNPNDSFNLKHRLTGAAILIAFAVVVLPMLLGGPDEPEVVPGPDASGEGDTKVFRSNITPIGGATPNAQQADGGEREPASVTARGAGDEGEAPQPASGAENAAADAGRAETTAVEGAGGSDEASLAAAEPVAEQAGEQAGAPEPESEPDAPAAVERGWIVQVGVFRESDNVDRLVAELENNGFGTSTNQVDTSDGQATRVWVGPYPTRVEAARMQTRVQQQVGPEGLIVAYP